MAPFEGESHARPGPIPIAPPVPPRHQIVGMRPMQEQPAGNVLEPGRGTIAAVPAQMLSQVDQFVLEDPLQRLQPVVAFQPADRDPAIVSRKPSNSMLQAMAIS